MTGELFVKASKRWDKQALEWGTGAACNTPHHTPAPTW